MGPEASWYDDKVVTERDGRLVQLTRESGAVDGYFDVAGGGALLPVEKPEPVRSRREVASTRVPPAEEYLEKGCLREVVACTEAAHADGLFVIGLCSSQTINYMVERMGHPEAALLLFLDDPALATALIDKAVEISIERGRALVQAGVDCLYIGDSYASASVISPEIYARFCVPAYTEVAREFRRQGVFCYKHCCGNYNPLLDHFPATGVDAMDGLDPTSGMRVGYTKERIGATVTLMGGLSCLTLLNGTPDEVYEEARACLAAGMPGGRFVLGSGCALARYTPAANVTAARDAVIDCGVYAEDD
jgi:uroporphyrinogen decarboxylase